MGLLARRRSRPSVAIATISGVVGIAGIAATAAIVALGIAFVTAHRARALRPAPRNVLVVCIDTLRADHLSAYGYPRATTPRLQALAARGTLFENAVSAAPWTVPSVASLLTSLYPGEHGAMVEGEVRELDEQTPSQLRPEVQTLGDLFHGAGLRTALFSGNPYLWGRFQRGFDAAVAERQTATELTDRAISWLRERPDEPFFLYLQYMDLHQPIEPPAAYANHFPVDIGGERGSEHRDWSFDRQSDLDDAGFRRFRAHKIALYDGALLYVDAEIGRLLDALSALGRRGDTLVVVTADHGEEFWDHAEAERHMGGDPRGIWGVGHGHSLYQELLHVPLLVAGPGVAAGRRVPCQVSLLDVAPTVLASLGLRPRPEMRGASLARFDGPGGNGGCDGAPLAAESPAYGPEMRALVWGGWKLIERDGAGPSLYDLARDPDERHDLAGCRPRALAALSGLLDHELAPRGPAAGQRGEIVPPDLETSRQLRSLGYLGGG